MIRVINEDCMEALKKMEDNSIDAIVTDPPYGLSQMPHTLVSDAITKWSNGERDYLPHGKGFMNVTWDSFVPSPALWDEAYRILKPGGHLLAFSGSRTFDLMTISIRLANFEIRDSLQWWYGTGMPKSMNVAKAVEATMKYGSSHPRYLRKIEQDGDGESYTLKGTNNGILGKKRTYDRKVYTPSTDEGIQWDGWGTALKPAFEPITLARKPIAEETLAKNILQYGTGALNIGDTKFTSKDEQEKWLTNLIIDENIAEMIDEQALNSSRFFFVPKPSTKEKPKVDDVSHETVKPLALMEKLVKLVTPVDGIVLDPFAGSGTTLESALQHGYSAIGVEREPKYIPLIKSRLERNTDAQDLFNDCQNVEIVFE